MAERFVMVLLVLLLAPLGAVATPQDDAEEPATELEAGETPAPGANEPEDTEGDAPRGLDPEVERRLAALEEANARQAAEIADLKASAEEHDLAALEELGGAPAGFEPTLNIYGFFDVSFLKWFIDEGDALEGAMTEDLTFVASDLNLYLQSQMTETLSFLAEIRFTFLPHATVDFNTGERRDTTVQDPHTNESVPLGGLFIERVHLTWQPKDWFGVTAGRFITPFGIWNIDHGSPVLLGSYAPYIMLNELVQLRQTGLMVHGRFVPRETWFLDYALTLSNGRGPTEQVYDLDDNKAVGLRLRSTFERGEVRFALGAYGYYGQTTDEITTYTSLEPLTVEVVTQERYTEITGSLDLLLELFGVRVQAEYARSLIRYRTRPPRRMPMSGIPITGQLQPDYTAWVGYVLLAWTLPLDALLGEMKLTPFVMVERSEPEDVSDEFNLWSVHGGLNFKPNSAVVLKLEFGYVGFTESEMFTNPAWMVGSQVAVAF